MTDDLIELGKRAVACKGWRWMPGMRTMRNPEYGVSGVPQTWVLPVSDGGLIDVGQHYQRRGQFPSALGQCVPGGGLGTRLPDLTDPATVGCLLALVRKAWEPYGTFVSTHRYDGGEWGIRTLPMPMFATEAEALVVALESAP